MSHSRAFNEPHREHSGLIGPVGRPSGNQHVTAIQLRGESKCPVAGRLSPVGSPTTPEPLRRTLLGMAHRHGFVCPMGVHQVLQLLGEAIINPGDIHSLQA